MTNKTKEQPYIADQARALATVILTRRGDLTIMQTKKEIGLDFHVFIDREDKAMRLIFGVLVSGVPSPTTAEGANKVLGPTVARFQGMRKFTYPVCLFFFTMRDEKPFFSWLAEPALTGDGPKLVHRDRANCVELTNEVLDGAIERVVAWYDAVEAVLIA